MNLNSDKKYTSLSYLHSISKGNTVFEQKMLTTFIAQAGSDLKNLKQALLQKDWETIHLIAHKLKPSLQFVGLDAIHGDVLSLELYAKQKANIDKTAELVSTISTIMELAIEEIKEELIAVDQKVN